MKVFVVENGLKTLFHEGKLDPRTVAQIKAEVCWYFGWRRICALKQGDEIYLFNADKIDRWRNAFCRKPVAEEVR